MCKVKGCKYQHTNHYCRNCSNLDSDHFASSCHQNPQRNQDEKIRCKAQNCTQRHKEHYCRVCTNTNSDHLASQCRKGKTLYHGTKYDAAISIQKTGFRPSTQGCIGAGVYFTDSFQDACKIAKRWGDTAGVLECRLDDDNDFVDEGMHGPWVGTGNFKQFVVREQYIKRVKIVKVHKV